MIVYNFILLCLWITFALVNLENSICFTSLQICQEEVIHRFLTMIFSNYCPLFALSIIAVFSYGARHKISFTPDQIAFAKVC